MIIASSKLIKKAVLSVYIQNHANLVVSKIALLMKPLETTTGKIQFGRIPKQLKFGKTQCPPMTSFAFIWFQIVMNYNTYYVRQNKNIIIP